MTTSSMAMSPVYPGPVVASITTLMFVNLFIAAGEKSTAGSAKIKALLWLGSSNLQRIRVEFSKAALTILDRRLGLCTGPLFILQEQKCGYLLVTCCLVFYYWHRAKTLKGILTVVLLMEKFLQSLAIPLIELLHALNWVVTKLSDKQTTQLQKKLPINSHLRCILKCCIEKRLFH